MPTASLQPQSALRRVARDWLPPKLARGARRLRARRTAPAPAAPPRPAPPRPAPAAATTPAPTAPVPADPRWSALTGRVLAGIEACDPVYRPTNFWQPGVRRLLAEMDELGLHTFKSWPEAHSWFYPIYGRLLTRKTRRRMIEVASAEAGIGTETWLTPLLRGLPAARRDFDLARMAWDQERWPFDFEQYGESEVGRPSQTYKLADSEARFGKPYLNYLLCLAALSRHVSAPPKRFLELGGGYGVLGEIVMARDPEADYVNLDIPPLLTVASFYLTELFGHDRVLTYDDRVPDQGPVEVPGSACLPNWRIEDLVGEFDVFVNSFSFQEMEPAVVEHYVDTVAKLGVDYAVSLNSRAGKPVATDDESVGVREQVTSATVIRLFEERGYELCATYNRPLISSAGELAVLRRR